MKKNIKTVLMSGIASALTATIIFVSGGGVVIATLLGGAGIIAIPSFIHLNDKRNDKKDTFYMQQTEDIQNVFRIINDDKELQHNQTQVLGSKKINAEPTRSITPIKQYDDNVMIQELVTIDALSQKESVLVRVRKKATEEKIKGNHNCKK